MNKLSPEAASAYVAHCLRLNPMWETDQILATRAEAHGATEEFQSPYQRAAEEAERKTALRDRVYKLRDNVWKSPLDKLRNELADLSLEGESDLQAIAGRLRVIANARTQLPALTQDKRFDGDFFDCFKQVLSGGPRESAAMRERVAASFQDKALGRRGIRMIKLLQREVPELYELESDWLRSLRKKKQVAVVETKGETNGCLIWFVGFIIVKAIVGLILALGK